MAHDLQLVAELSQKHEAKNLEEVIEFPWLSKEVSEQLNGPIVLGQFTISPKKVTIFVNSDERASIVRTEIEQRLGDVVKYQTTVYQSAVDSEQRPSTPTRQPEIPPDLMEGLIKTHDRAKNKMV